MDGKQVLLRTISTIILTSALIISSFACGAPPKTPAATFEVVSLDVTPSEAIIGQEVTISAKIANIGKVQGTYTAVLIVNKVEAARKDVTIPLEATQLVTFQLKKDTGGNYAIELGGLSKNLTVRKLASKEVELKYDDGIARDSISSCGGYLVDFTPPALPFTLKKVSIFGAIRGEQKAENFEVEVWDKDAKVLTSIKLPVTKFATEKPSWIEVELPNLEIKGKFFVHVYTGTCRMEGIHVGADDSVKNEHSTCTIRRGGVTTESSWAWLYPSDRWFADKSKVNWMIRVVGTVMVPAE
jgi:hypothetical protein